MIKLLQIMVTIMNDELLNKFKDTSIYEELKRVEEIYLDLEKKQDIFCNTFNVHCKKGCGTCCEHFIPDVYALEARYLAYGIIKEGKAEVVRKRINEWSEESAYCPLYDFDSNFHCTVYKYRPLVCRLFGATASKNKEGLPCFRKCKYNKEGIDLSPVDLNKNKEAVICMSDYAMMLKEFSQEENTKDLLPVALIKELDKLSFLLDLLSQND